MNKKVIVQGPRVNSVTVIPTVSQLLTDSMVILGTELARYRAIVQRGQALDQKEARIVRDYIESIVRLSREARESTRAEDLSSLTNEELLKLATDLLSKKEDK